MRSPRRFPALAALAALALLTPALLTSAVAQTAFECPVRAPAATHPLPGDLGRTLKPFDDPRADPALKADIRTMAREGMPLGEVVDHVVAAYCPAVAGMPGLSTAEKDAMVQRFASRVAQDVYAPAGDAVESILVDVPVPTDLYDRVKALAERRHESQDAFVLDALRKAAEAP